MLYSCRDRSMDQSEFDMGAADLPQRGSRSQALVRVIEAALPLPLVRRAREAIVRLGSERLRQSYFTTFWLRRGSVPAHAVEEAVIALWRLAGARRCDGAEWWLGRAYTTDIPVEFHFDEDVKGRRRRHPRLSSVFSSTRSGAGSWPSPIRCPRAGPRCGWRRLPRGETATRSSRATCCTVFSTLGGARRASAFRAHAAGCA